MEKDYSQEILEGIKRIEERLSIIEDKIFVEEQNIIQSPIKIDVSREKSFMEFYLEYNMKNATDKTLVIMYFLEKMRERQEATTKDISEGFKEIREKPPLNISDKIQMLHKKGFIMPGETINGLKSWTITRRGLIHLEELKNE